MKKIKTEHVVFAIYSAVLLWLILFKLSSSLDDIMMLAGERRVNFIPFYYDNDPNVRHHIKEALMNFAVFVPFGFYLCAFGLSFKKGILAAGLTSLTLELIQLVFAIGGADITDLITNTLGALFGILIFITLLKIFKNEKRIVKFINAIAIVGFSLFFALMSVLILAN